MPLRRAEFEGPSKGWTRWVGGRRSGVNAAVLATVLSSALTTCGRLLLLHLGLSLDILTSEILFEAWADQNKNRSISLAVDFAMARSAVNGGPSLNPPSIVIYGYPGLKWRDTIS